MVEALKTILLEYPLLAPLVFILVRILPIVIPPLPGVLLDFLGLAVFGWKMGFLLSLIGINLASITSFHLARYYREPLVIRFASLKTIEKWEEKYSSNQKFWSLVVLRFLTAPFFDLINYVAGLTKIPPLHYHISTLVSTTPVIFIFYYFGGITLSMGWSIFFLFLFSFISFIYLISKRVNLETIMYKKVAKSFVKGSIGPMKKGYIYILVLGILVALFALISQFNSDDFKERKGISGASEYVEAAALGGDYLIDSIYPDGAYIYEYNPITRTESDSYNILRHAGTTYSLLELYEATGEERFLNGAEDALLFLKNQITECPTVKNALCVVEHNEIKLGGNGLALLAFAKHKEVTKSDEYLSTAQGLARYIVGTQSPQGEFIAHQVLADSGKVTDFKSDYYPGEAIFGLARLYEQDGNKAWIMSAHKGAYWLINVRDRGIAISDLEHDHWLLYGLNELYEHVPDPLYLTHTRKIVDAITQAQRNSLTGSQAIWNGGYATPAQSTPTATRSEGLGAAYQLFKRAGDTVYMNRALETLKKGVVFQLKTQITEDKARKFNLGPESVGAFTESLEDLTIRIDFVQHNISALLGLDRILSEK